MNDIERIPVTIITGFLGSGKTTLLNNVIEKYTGKKFAIIENEFGSVGIDGALIVEEGNNIFELNNGCICCSLNDDFYTTISQLLESELEFNHLLVETTGIANPDSVINAFLLSEEIVERFIIDSVICVVDAENMEDMMEIQPEVIKQLAVADIVLINKTDCVQPNYVHQLRNIIAGLNFSASIYSVQQADISEIDLLDIFCFSPESVEMTTHKFIRIKPHTAIDAPPSSLLISNIKPQHKHEISSEGFYFEGSFSFERFSLWIQNFMYLNSETIYRVKGILSFDGMPEKFTFQAVRTTYLFDYNEEWKNEMRYIKIVFIGKNINPAILEASLKDLLVIHQDNVVENSEI
ncbi:MAG: cobalamin synthesis protein CobW [Bacteroidetes bacterium]|nr:cobalamin synthesis protein CobW [Bacteroidota bacterium]